METYRMPLVCIKRIRHQITYKILYSLGMSMLYTQKKERRETITLIYQNIIFLFLLRRVRYHCETDRQTGSRKDTIYSESLTSSLSLYDAGTGPIKNIHSSFVFVFCFFHRGRMKTFNLHFFFRVSFTGDRHRAASQTGTV